MRKNDDYVPDGIEPGSAGKGEQKPMTAEDAPSAVPPAATQVRGSFDIRPGRQGADGARRKLILGVSALGLVFLMVLAGMWTLVISQMKTTTKVDESAVKADATLSPEKGADESMKKAQAEMLRQQTDAERKAKAENESRDRENKRDSNSTSGNTNTNGTNQPPPAKNDSPVITPAMRKMGGGMVVTPAVQDVTGYGAAGSQNKAASGEAPDGAPHLVDAQGNGGLTDSGNGSGSRSRGSLNSLSGTTFAPSKAYLAPSRKYLVSHNTYTRCALYTEIVTDQPGLVDCRLTGPLYSADGSTVIAAAGDKLTGEQTVSVAQGQARVFTTWTELETQSGTRARINSLGAGPMGASGTDAWIDHHWKEKFLGAAMLSIFQDGMQAIVNSTQKTGSGYTVNNSEQNVESMANKVLDSTINIPDTGHVLPGTVITVIVARDIDFSSVFENR